jgi:hypothetical protein
VAVAQSTTSSRATTRLPARGEEGRSAAQISDTHRESRAQGLLRCETSVLERPRNNPEMKDFWSAHAESTLQGSVSKVAIPG